MPFIPGTTVGAYRILEQLGQGGMATVYKAYHASLDRYVAIKVLHQAFLQDASFLARFQREARLVARLEHPNIVPIYDYAEYEGQPYLVMKYIEGETLKSYLTSGNLTPGEVLRIVETVGSALAYAHKQNILHRDIKPSNVIIANDGSLYLADFGLARIAQSNESTLTSDMVLGTPQYISPEQAMSKKELDEGTDIYSFGVMVYEMTVGKVPFSADTPFSVIHDHIYTPLPLPSQVNPRISMELERVLLKALAKERADRFADVPAFVDAFRQAWNDKVSTQALPAMAASPLPPRESAALTSPVAQPVNAPKADSGVTVAQEIPAGAPSKTTVAAEIKIQKINWLWVGLGVLFCFGCVAAAWALNRIGQNRLSPPPMSTPIDHGDNPLPPVIDPPAIDMEMYPTAEDIPAYQPPALDVLDLADAKRQARLTPDRPVVQARLGAALINDGQKEEGYQAIQKAAELARKEPNILASIGDALDKHGYPLGALMMYVRLVEQNRRPSNTLIARLHRTAYYGFSDPIAPDVLSYEALSQADLNTALIAEARYAQVVEKDPPATADLIQKMRGDGMFVPEADLIEAEQATLTDPERARKLLNGLLENQQLPYWIRLQAEHLLGEIK